jgi:hypothetical protein
MLLSTVLLISACHPGPVLNTGDEMRVGGTIAGTVSSAGGTVALSARKVTATNIATGATFDASTSVTGGYTIKVPGGTYRLQVELHGGETLAKQPEDTQVNNGDLDPGRDFQITAAP